MEECMGTRMDAIAQRFAASQPPEDAAPLAGAPPQP